MSASARAVRPGLLGLVALVLAVYYGMAVAAVAGKSVTFDEMAHLTAGYTYWADNDYRLHPENGNWPQRWVALPVVLGTFRFPPLDQPAWTLSNMYVLGDQFFYLLGNDADAMLLRGRAMAGLLGVALGALVFFWARRLLVPPAGAWVSLLLFAFSPTLLAHGPLATSDMAAALFFTAAVGAIWAAWHRLTPWTLAGSAVLVAGVFLSKFSAPVLIPIAFVMLVVRLVGGRPLVVCLGTRTIEITGRTRQLAVAAAVAVVYALVTWGLIWASYGFRYTAFAAATNGRDAFMAPLVNAPGLVTTIVAAARQHHFLPEAYLYGFAYTMQYAAQRVAFLNGQFSTTGWWWFFPYAFAVKTTLPAMGLALLALAALIARWRGTEGRQSRWPRVRASLYAGTPLVALLIVYWAFALASHLNIGHRHLLPAYPALFILAGGAAFWIQPLFARSSQAVPTTGRERRKDRALARRPHASPGRLTIAGGLTLALLAWHGVESVAVSPNYLAYFNELAGGPAHGYTHLVDSSLDWGQDLPALKQWLDSQGLQQPGSPPVYLSYFGTGRPEYYGIEATQLPGFVDRRPRQTPEPLGGGVYCVSASMLNLVGQMFWKPEDEPKYQAALKNMAIFERAAGNEQARAALLAQTGEEFWWQTFQQFDQLRMGRLAAFLRQRRPDAQVDYTILIYRLTDADVTAALNGPAPGAGPK